MGDTPIEFLRSRRAGELIVKPMPFEPQITVDRSHATGQLAWIFHFPDGKTEIGGTVGVVARQVAIELYVKRLSRVGVLCDVSDVKATIPPAPVTPPRADTRKQWEIVLDALENGAVTSFEIARDTGMSPGPVAAILTQQLEAKGRAHRVGTLSGKGKSLTWAPGPAPKEVPAQPVEEPCVALAPTPKEIVVVPAPIQTPTVTVPVVVPAVQTESRADSHRVKVQLNGGGTLDIHFKGNVFDLDGDDRAFFFDLVDRVATYKDTGK